MRLVCVFYAVYVCVCAVQSKTGSIVETFEILLIINHIILLVTSHCISIDYAIFFVSHTNDTYIHFP